jgi:hypothetical protein
MRLLILGAGSSIGTLGIAACPGVKGFGNALAGIRRDWRTAFVHLAQVVDDTTGVSRGSDNWALDDVWTRLDYIAKLAPAWGAAPYAPEASLELHTAIAAVYGPAFASIASVMPRAGKADTLPWLLSRVEPGDVVASFNWDTLAEGLLTERLRGSGTRLVQAHSGHPSGSVVLIKPHGSLAWPRRLAGQVRQPDGSPMIVPVNASAILTEPEQPMLLGAVPIKSELMVEIQRGENSWVYRTVMEQWRALGDAIAAADEIIAVGYGFPEEDAYGRFLIREAARKRGSRRWKLSLYAPKGRGLSEDQATARRMARALGLASPRSIRRLGPLLAP